MRATASDCTDGPVFLGRPPAVVPRSPGDGPPVLGGGPGSSRLGPVGDRRHGMNRRPIAFFGVIL
jgi:hypothetical protein